MILSLTAFALSLTGALAPAAWGALLGCAARANDERAIGPGEFWKDFRRLGWRSTALGAALAIFVALAAFNVWFIFGAKATAPWPPAVRYASAALFFWVGVFGTIWLMAAWAFVAMQDLPTGKALLRGALLVSSHPVACLLTALTGLGSAIVLIVSGLGIPLLLGGALANLVMAAPAVAIEYHEEAQDALELERLKNGPVKNRAALAALDERAAQRERRYANRLKDLLKPWDM